MAFGTFTKIFEQMLVGGPKMVCGTITAANGDTALSIDMSSYFSKAIKWGSAQTVGAEKGIAAVDITTTATTFAATITDPLASVTLYVEVYGF